MTLIRQIIQKTREFLGVGEECPPPKPKPKPKPPPKPKPKPHPHPKPKPKPKPKPVKLEGIDYSAGSGITAAQIRNAGKAFVFRYLSHDPSKDIDKQELWNLLNGKLAVGLYWETTADRALGGKLAGIADGYEVKQRTIELGIGQIPCYFAVDFDATPGDQGQINAYLSGVGQTIGLRRTGIYGGYWPVKRAFDAKVVSYAVQTYAWSGNNWDPRAQVQQYQNGVNLHGAEVDLLRSNRKDFGQWPRP